MVNVAYILIYIYSSIYPPSGLWGSRKKINYGGLEFVEQRCEDYIGKSKEFKCNEQK